MSVLLIRLLPYIAGALVLLGIGTYTGYHVNPYKGRYEALQTSDAQKRLQRAEEVRKALQAQQVQSQKTSQNNAQVRHELELKNTAIALDHAVTLSRVHRLEQLLAAQAARTARSPGVPEAGSGSGTAAAGADPSPDRIGDLLVNARTECKRNAARLDSLIAEIKPQL